MKRRYLLILVFGLLIILALFLISKQQEGQKMISEFGKYQGYTEKV